MRIQLSDSLERERIDLLIRRDAFLQKIGKNPKPTNATRREYSALRKAINDFIAKL